MGDSFLMNEGSVSSVVDLLHGDIENYNSAIDDLNRLIEEIGNSTSWKDAEVKTAFISTCQGYIAKYKNLSLSMNRFVDYLDSKSKSMGKIDSAYAKGGTR